MNTSYKKSNFASAFFFLPKAKKEALANFYAFCRVADDIADEPSPNPKEQLDTLRKEVQNPTTPFMLDLEKDIKTFNIDKIYLMEILDGMEMDLNKTFYSTFDDLRLYMYRVACAVGLVSIQIFGYKNENTKQFALATGYAVQMTNIIRDIFEDFAIGRVYIPKEHLDKFEVSVEDIENKNFAKLKPLLEFEAVLAKDFYETARATLPKEDYKSMLPARIMAAVYEEVLRKIEATGFEFKEKVRLTKLEKFKIILKTILK